MSLDTGRNSPYVETPLRWFSPRDTTPFSLNGHIGPVLAALPSQKYGPGVTEVWFGDDGWVTSEGTPIPPTDILAFAIPRTPWQDALDKITSRLGELFGCDTQVGAWLQSPQPLMGGKTPMELIECGQADHVLASVQSAVAGDHL